jgi:hypothetical protein
MITCYHPLMKTVSFKKCSWLYGSLIVCGVEVNDRWLYMIVAIKEIDYMLTDCNEAMIVWCVANVVQNRTYCRLLITETQRANISWYCLFKTHFSGFIDTLAVMYDIITCQRQSLKGPCHEISDLWFCLHKTTLFIPSFLVWIRVRRDTVLSFVLGENRWSKQWNTVNSYSCISVEDAV